MDIVTLLTTWNRPQYLRQSLPLIIEEAKSLGPLMVVDNGSEDQETLDLIHANVKDFDAFLCHPRSRMKLDAHWHCGDAAIAAFNKTIEEFPDRSHILKLDDDIYFEPRAFGTIMDAWKTAEDDGHLVAACTGIQTVNETTTQSFEGYNLVRSPCAAACIYEANDMKRLFCGQIAHANIRQAGWDWTFSDTYILKNKPIHKFVATNPSVVYHAGFTGTHSKDSDFNKNYEGNLEGIVT